MCKISPIFMTAHQTTGKFDMGIKIEQKAQTITPFGGISFVNDAL